MKTKNTPLYRALTVDGDTVYGFLVRTNDGAYIIDNDIDSIDKVNEHHHLVMDGTVSEYVGRTDSVGNNIYTNDLVVMEYSFKMDCDAEDYFSPSFIETGHGFFVGKVGMTSSGAVLKRPVAVLYNSSEYEPTVVKMSKDKKLVPYRTTVIGNVFDADVDFGDYNDYISML